MRKYFYASALTIALVLALTAPAQPFALSRDASMAITIGLVLWLAPSLGIAYIMGRFSGPSASPLRTTTNLLICAGWTAFASLALQLAWGGVLEYAQTDYLFSPRPLFYVATAGLMAAVMLPGLLWMATRFSLTQRKAP